MDLDRLIEIARVISGKWRLNVLAHAASGPKGHNELARLIGIDHKQLDRTLRDLQTVGLLTRHVHTSSSPVRVSYRLTPKGSDILDLLDSLVLLWGNPQARPESADPQVEDNLGEIRSGGSRLDPSSRPGE